jgi:F0F1-type ATP synthase assembly protein I
VNRDQQQINQTALLAGIVGQVGCVTVILIAIAFGAGVLLDNLLGTRPIFTILLLIGSVPVTLYVIVRLSLTATARLQPPAPPAEDLEEETEE